MGAIAVAILCASRPATAQTQAAVPIPDTALTSDMVFLDRALLERARNTLERFGNTFGAYAAYTPDTVSFQVIEIGPQSFVESREPSVMRDSLRAAIRRQQVSGPVASTVAVITDSIVGDLREAVDGAQGPQFPRLAITEVEDKGGWCRRLERTYRFVPDSSSEWGFGKVVFDAPRITRCTPLGYWPQQTSEITPTEPERPRLAKPIVRPLKISSLNNYFSVVGEFSGTLTVNDDSIVVKFDRILATRRLPNDTQAVKLDSIRVGVGMGDNERWSPVDDSKALRVGLPLAPGGRLVFRNRTFVLPHERRDADDAAWIVVTFHITAGRPGEPHYSRQATTYAHSVKGVLAEDDRE